MGGFASSVRRGPSFLAVGLLLGFGAGCGQSSSSATSATAPPTAEGAPSGGTPPGAPSGSGGGPSDGGGTGGGTSAGGGTSFGGASTPSSTTPSPPPGSGAGSTGSSGTGGSSSGSTSEAPGGSGGASGSPSAGSPPVDPCAGLVPGSVGVPVEVSIGRQSVCGASTTDPSGRVALGSWNGFAWQMSPYSASGSPAGTAMQPLSANGDDLDRWFHWTSSGFRGIVRGAAYGFPTQLQTWDASGSPVGSSYRGVVSIAPDGQGGSVAIVPDPTSLPNAIAPPKFLDWIDARGNLIRSVSLGEDAGALLVNWGTGHVFVLVFGSSIRPTQGRWYDGVGTPLTGWFSLAVPKGTGATWHLLVDGTLVLSGPDGAWIVGTKDGVEGPMAVPDWLASRPRTRLSTIRDGRAYALVSGANGQLEIVTAAGASCGTVTFPVPPASPGAAPQRFDIGQDGTVIQAISTGSAGDTTACTFDWWPGLLR